MNATPRAGGSAAESLSEGGTACAVVRVHGEYSLVAVRAIAAGTHILAVEGRLTSRPARTSVQVGARAHVDMPEGWALERVLDECPWRFLNHSCDPNSVLRGRELFALRAIARWEELTFDYATTEWELASPFACRCGAAGCTGALVRGFRHLAPAERLRRLPLLAAHLRERLDEATGALRYPDGG